MSNLTDFFPSGGGGGLTPKFEEFNSSGTFSPSQALIDAGGYIEVFLVGGGGVGNYNTDGGCGGETILKKMYLTSTTSLPVVIGAGGTPSARNGSASTFNGITAAGGVGNKYQDNKMSSGFGAAGYEGSAGSGLLGYGVGGGTLSGTGVRIGKPNSGQGAAINQNAGSGYCLIKWYE